MDSPEVMIAFAAVMLVIALLGVAVDWFGKPLRHRKFRPKIYRFPDERQPRRSQVRETEWSETAFVLPVVDQPPPDMLVRYPDPRHVGDAGAPPAIEAHAGDAGPPTTQVPITHLGGAADDPLPELVTFEDTFGSDAAGLLHPDELGEPGDAERLIVAGTLASHELGDGDHGDPVAPDSVDHSGDLVAKTDGDDLVGTDDADPSSDPGADDRDHNELAGTDGDAGKVEGNEAAGAGKDDTSDRDAPSVGRAAAVPARARGWKPGDYVFNFTKAGDEPAPDTVRSRYWKNVASTAGTAMFGSSNTQRMSSGKPPERRNPRTGKIEIMRLPKVGYTDAGGATPVPEWPLVGLDPFADSVNSSDQQ